MAPPVGKESSWGCGVSGTGERREPLELDEARVEWTRAGRAQAVEERMKDEVEATRKRLLVEAKQQALGAERDNVSAFGEVT